MASLAVRNSPSASNGSEGIDASEEPWHGFGRGGWERQEEPPIEEAVGLLARGLGREAAAVAGSAVEEVLWIARCAHGTNGVR